MKYLITDVDGVLTDGSFGYDETGKVFKVFGAHDSDGIKFFRSIGVEVIAITADHRGFRISSRRLMDMGVDHYLVSEAERKEWICDRFDPATTGFVGDGYHDIQVFKSVEYSWCPSNAPRVVKENCKINLATSGGSGVLLDVFESYLNITNDERLSLFLEGGLR